MIFIPVALAIVLSQKKSPPTADVLIISNHVANPQQFNDVLQEPSEQAIADLQHLGYHLYEKDKDRVLFSPEIWQEEKLTRASKIYLKLGAAARPDGTLDLSDPDVRSFAQGQFAGFGVELGQDTTVGIQLRRTYEMASGSKTIKVSGPPINLDAGDGAMKSHPATYHAGKPIEGKGSGVDHIVVWPAKFEIYGLGAYKFSSVERFEVFRRALQVLEGRLDSYSKTKRNDYSAMNRAIAGRDITQDYGKNFGSLSDEVQGELLNAMRTRFPDFGFASADEAENFVKGATLSGTNTNVTLIVCGGANGGSPQFFSSDVP